MTITDIASATFKNSDEKFWATIHHENLPYGFDDLPGAPLTRGEVMDYLTAEGYTNPRWLTCDMGIRSDGGPSGTGAVVLLTTLRPGDSKCQYVTCPPGFSVGDAMRYYCLAAELGMSDSIGGNQWRHFMADALSARLDVDLGDEDLEWVREAHWTAQSTYRGAGSDAAENWRCSMGQTFAARLKGDLQDEDHSWLMGALLSAHHA